MTKDKRYFVRVQKLNWYVVCIYLVGLVTVVAFDLPFILIVDESIVGQKWLIVTSVFGSLGFSVVCLCQLVKSRRLLFYSEKVEVEQVK